MRRACQDQLPLGWQLNINLNIPEPTEGEGGLQLRVNARVARLSISATEKTANGQTACEGNRSGVCVSIPTEAIEVTPSIKPQLLLGTGSIRATGGDGRFSDQTVVVITFSGTRADGAKTNFLLAQLLQLQNNTGGSLVALNT